MANKLRAWREAQGITLRKMAKQIGLSQPYLSQIELGIKVPSLAAAAAIVGFAKGALEIDDLLPTNLARKARAGRGGSGGKAKKTANQGGRARDEGAQSRTG